MYAVQYQVSRNVNVLLYDGINVDCVNVLMYDGMNVDCVNVLMYDGMSVDCMTIPSNVPH